MQLNVTRRKRHPGQIEAKAFAREIKRHHLQARADKLKESFLGREAVKFRGVQLNWPLCVRECFFSPAFF